MTIVEFEECERDIQRRVAELVRVTRSAGILISYPIRLMEDEERKYHRTHCGVHISEDSVSYIAGTRTAVGIRGPYSETES